MRLATLLTLLALLLTGAARGQSIAIPRSQADSHVIADGDGSVNDLANGERWLIINSRGGLGIQIVSGMPVGPTGQFQTNIVINIADSSVESSVVGDCKTDTYEFMSNVVYEGTYRTGKGDGEPDTLDHELKHMEPGTDMEYVFAVACATP